MTEKEFFAPNGPVDRILQRHGVPKYGAYGRESMLNSWFLGSTDHGFNALDTAREMLDEIDALPIGENDDF